MKILYKNLVQIPFYIQKDYINELCANFVITQKEKLTRPFDKNLILESFAFFPIQIDL